MAKRHYKQDPKYPYNEQFNEYYDLYYGWNGHRHYRRSDGYIMSLEDIEGYMLYDIKIGTFKPLKPLK